MFRNELEEVERKTNLVNPVRMMYHGTRNNSPGLIYKSEEGFDMRLSPGGMWGRANYFAANSSYSHQYRHKIGTDF